MSHRQSSGHSFEMSPSYTKNGQQVSEQSAITAHVDLEMNTVGTEAEKKYSLATCDRKTTIDDNSRSNDCRGNCDQLEHSETFHFAKQKEASQDYYGH